MASRLTLNMKVPLFAGMAAKRRVVVCARATMARHFGEQWLAMDSLTMAAQLALVILASTKIPVISPIWPSAVAEQNVVGIRSDCRAVWIAPHCSVSLISELRVSTPTCAAVVVVAAADFGRLECIYRCSEHIALPHRPTLKPGFLC